MNERIRQKRMYCSIWADNALNVIPIYIDFISLDITVLIWLDDKNVNQNNDCIPKAFSMVFLCLSGRALH